MTTSSDRWQNADQRHSAGAAAERPAGLPLTRPCSLAKATTEPVKVIAPIATPIDISIREAALIVDLGHACRCHRPRDCRRRPPRPEHGGQADQAVEGGNQLRQRRHLDAHGDEGADRRRRSRCRQNDQDVADVPGRPAGRVSMAMSVPMAMTMPDDAEDDCLGEAGLRDGQTRGAPSMNSAPAIK